MSATVQVDTSSISVVQISISTDFTFYFQSLLDEPNPNSPANNLAAKLYQENRREYEKKVKVVVEESWIYTGEMPADGWVKGWMWLLGDCIKSKLRHCLNTFSHLHTFIVGLPEVVGVIRFGNNPLILIHPIMVSCNVFVERLVFVGLP